MVKKTEKKTTSRPRQRQAAYIWAGADGPVADTLDACDLYYAAVRLAMVCIYPDCEGAPSVGEVVEQFHEAWAEYHYERGDTGKPLEGDIPPDTLLLVADTLIRKLTRGGFAERVLPPLRQVYWKMHLTSAPCLFVDDMKSIVDILRRGDGMTWREAAIGAFQINAKTLLDNFVRLDAATMEQVVKAHPQHKYFRGSHGLSIHSLWQDTAVAEQLGLLAHDYWQTCDEYAHLKYEHIDTGKWEPRFPTDTMTTQLQAQRDQVSDFEYEFELARSGAKTSIFPSNSPASTLQWHRDRVFGRLECFILDNRDALGFSESEICTEDFALPHPDECSNIDEWHKHSLAGPVKALSRQINIATNLEIVSEQRAAQKTDARIAETSSEVIEGKAMPVEDSDAPGKPLEGSQDGLEQPSDPEVPLFTRIGDYWNVEYQGITNQFRDRLGIRYVAYLIDYPYWGFDAHRLYEIIRVQKLKDEGRSAELSGQFLAEGLPEGIGLEPPSMDEYGNISNKINVLTLTSRLGSAGPDADGQTLKDIRKRQRDIEGEIAEEGQFGSDRCTETLQAEWDKCDRYIKGAMGIRPRQGADPGDRARKAVSKAIRQRFYKKLKDIHPELLTYLEAHLKIGFKLYYATGGLEMDAPVKKIL